MDFTKLPLGDRAALRAALLPDTLTFAATHVPHYRRLRGVTSLRDWPVLRKAEAIAHQRELLSSTADAFTGVVSSGTQHGTAGVLQVPRTHDEREARAAFFRAMSDDDGERPKGWVLEVRAAHHGASEAEAGRLLLNWTYSAQALRLTEQMLSQRQVDGRRVTSMVINAGALMPLTSWFLSRGVDPRKFKLEGLGTTSFRLSPFWERLVEEVWGCPVHDNFSLSELPAPAFHCEACGFNHWLAPPMVSEVLDPFTEASLSKGTGVLVCTTLVPFVTRMPLIRYWTDDVVTLGPRCARVGGERGIRARGRLAQSLAHRRHGVLVAALDVTDFLDGRAEVARHAHPMETLGLIPPGECGAVKCELSLEGRVARVKVELRFDPLVFSDEARALGEALSKHLLAASPGLRGFEREGGELVVEVLRPGSLTTRWAKF